MKSVLLVSISNIEANLEISFYCFSCINFDTQVFKNCPNAEQLDDNRICEVESAGLIQGTIKFSGST